MRLKPLLAATLALSLVTAGAARAASLDEMAGQMIVVGFAGDSAKEKSVAALVDEIASGGVGGVMFLKTNVKSKAAVTAMNKAFAAAAPAGLPPLLTIDQEGGAVERLTSAVGFEEVAAARDVAAKLDAKSAEALYLTMAKGLRSWGFNVNFAPVVDLAVNPDNPVIVKYGRAFSKDPAIVADYANAVIEAHHAAGLVTSLKHFPGHGSSSADSHEGYVDITRTWSDTELEPYRQLIGRGYSDMVMVGHLIDTKIDAEGLPASLSPAWITGKLRGELGFTGVVISDDLEMGAIREQFTLEQTVIKAVEAGEDILLFSNTAYRDPALADKVRAILVKQAEADPAFAKRIAESYARIVALKSRIGK